MAWYNKKSKSKEPYDTAIDIDFYRELYIDLMGLDGKELIKHWNVLGKKEGRFVTLSDLLAYYETDEESLQAFDFLFYVSFYDDLNDKVKTHYQAIHHYLEYGVKENRHTSLIALLQSVGFDEKAYLKANPDIQNLIDEGKIKDGFEHLQIGGLEEIQKGWRKFHHRFEPYDEALYIVLFPDAKEAVEEGRLKTGFVHFYSNGYRDIVLKTKPWPEMSNKSKKSVKKDNKTADKLSILSEEEKYFYNIIDREKLDLSDYFTVNTHPTEYTDPLIDYIKNWSIHEPVILNVFDTQFYLEAYPDIKEAKVNPLWHYLYAGKEEGRAGLIDADSYIKEGKKAFQSHLETVIFVSHESSATGAPLLGYNIVEGLNEYNVIHIVIKSSKIHEMFFENCSFIVEDILINPKLLSKYIIKQMLDSIDIKCAIYNSIVTSPVLDGLSELMIPSVFLVHEFADYTRPVGRMSQTIFYADQVIVPANIIKKSIQEELKEMYAISESPSNIIILPQGKLPILAESYGDDDTPEELLRKFKITNKNEVKIIVASGYVQIRKGTDLFVQLARWIKKQYKGKVKFVWVGEGYDPVIDMAYSAWLKREIEYANLGDDLIFLEHQKNLDNIFAIADLFCLTSRMDPFPNVVIDALSHDLPIACFDNATGCSEFLAKTNAQFMMSDYLDVKGLAEKIVKYLKNKDIKKGINKNIALTALDFGNYVHELKKIMNTAIAIQKDNMDKADKILSHGCFDAEYSNSDMTEKIACMNYISWSKKGLHTINPNPAPSFNQKKWLLENPHDEGCVPLFEALLANTQETHMCQIVPSKNNDVEVKFTYAIHLHLYYIDLAEEFKDYFKNLPGVWDLFITMVDEETTSEVLNAFAECGARTVDVTVVENIGRDIGPLLFGLKEKVLHRGYEVIGHFHSKKSIATDNDMGNRWREFLMQNLVGDREVARSVLALFEDPKTGLIFPSDKHTVGIGDNREFLDSLCTMLQLPQVEDAPILPLGNMFWARLDAIKDLFALSAEEILQPEPLPYDGSYMHALERITPHLVAQRGYTYATVYRRGTKW